MKKVLITGASGLLGREVLKTFQVFGWDVLGLAYTRAKDNLKKVDLTDTELLQDVIKEYQVMKTLKRLCIIVSKVS